MTPAADAPVLVALHAEIGGDLAAWRAEVARARAGALACGGIAPERVRRSYDYVPLVLVGAGEAARMIGCPQVRAVAPDIQLRPQTAESVPLIGADVWQAAGWTGAGGAVAVIDSGVRWSEPQLGGCLGAGCKVVGEDVADGDGDPDDCTGHGTSVAAIAAGSRGVAPGATVVALKVFSDRDCYNADLSVIAAGMDRAVALRDRHNILAINLSLGGSVLYDAPCDDRVAPEAAYNAALEAVAAAGIGIVVSAGNNGDPRRVSYPACWSGSFAVAAVYDADQGPIYWANCSDEETGADRIACFSNGGPMVDMAAPGAMIRAGGEEMGGTSQAAPHISGALLLLAEADRAAGGRADPAELLERLRAAGTPIHDRRGPQDQTYPRLDLGGLLPEPAGGDSAGGDSAGGAGKGGGCGCASEGGQGIHLSTRITGWAAGLAAGLAGLLRQARRTG